MMVEPIVVKNNNQKTWSSKIEESGKFRIGRDSAFTTTGRYAYIRLLINGFNTHPQFADVSFEELFNPLNGYANFQTLLNIVQVPVDLEGFYLNDQRKAHLHSPFLSPTGSQ